MVVTNYYSEYSRTHEIAVSEIVTSITFIVDLLLLVFIAFYNTVIFSKLF